MIISDARIGAKQFDCVGSIAIEEAQTTLDEWAPCRVLQPVAYRGYLRRNNRAILLNVDIEALIEHVCDRCGGEFQRAYVLHVELTLVEATSLDQGENAEISLTSEDLDTVTYENHQIDLFGILLESLYLEFPTPCLCQADDCLEQASPCNP